MLQLEARRPQTLGGLARSINWRAYGAGLRRYKDEMELSFLRGLLAGATWTATPAGSQHMRPSLDFPSCPGWVPETEGHILWDRPRWAKACDEWLPWAPLHGGGPSGIGTDGPPAYMRNACVIQARPRKELMSRLWTTLYTDSSVWVYPFWQCACATSGRRPRRVGRGCFPLMRPSQEGGAPTPWEPLWGCSRGPQRIGGASSSCQGCLGTTNGTGS